MTIADALNEFIETVQGVDKAHGKTPFIKSGEMFSQVRRELTYRRPQQI